MLAANLRRLLAALALVAALALPGLAEAASARAILTLVVNTVQRGEATVILEDGDVLMTPRDLSAAGLVHLPPGRAILRGGVAHRSLSALAPRLRFVLDEADLVLGLTVAPDVFEGKRLSLGPKAPADMVLRQDTSAFLNYSFQLRDLTHLQEVSELGLSLRGNLLYSGVTFSTDTGVTRNLTSYTVDDRRSLLRWAVGDSMITTGPLGGAVTLGGLTVSRTWEIDPYFIRAPTLGYAGMVGTPSTLEVYVNGVLQRREALPPGPFRISDLQVPTGAGNVRYVIRDAFGGEHAFSSGYYAAPGVLRHDLSDLACGVGFVRGHVGTASFEYGVPALVGRYRYAFTDQVTAGGRLEVGQGFASAGVTTSLALTHGELDLSAAGSFSQGRWGSAAQAGYSYVSRRASISVYAQAQSPRYATVSQAAGDDRQVLSAGASTSVSLGRRLTVGSQEIFVADRDQGISTRASALANVEIAKGLGLVLAVARSTSFGQSPSIDATATFNLTLPSRIGAAVGAGVVSGQRQIVGDVNRPLPPGTGFGFRAAGSEGDTFSADLTLEAQSQWGTYLANYQNTSGAQHGLLQVAGGVVAVEGGGVFFTRPVQNGFAVVDAHAPNVRAMLDNNVVGRTGSDGKMVIPNLLPYYGNRVGLVDADLPVDFSIQSVEQIVAAPYRGGALVRFAAKRSRFARGTFLFHRGGRDVPPAYGELTLRGDGHEGVSPLGARGEFEFEDLPPGRYEATASFTGGTCRTTIDLPASEAAVQDLGTVRCEAPDQEEKR